MKTSIRFPKLTPWTNAILPFIQLFRASLAILAAAAGSTAVYALNPTLPLHAYLLTGLIPASMTAAACAINDYWDVNKDRINHPERPLPSGRLSLQQARLSAVLLFTIALLTAIPLGKPAFILVAVSTVLLWYYSLLLSYSGILGNFLVATIIALLLLFSSLVANRPFALLYPISFLFCYSLAREILWDVHDAEGDRMQGVVTLANGWGKQAAFSAIWGLIAVMIVSVPIAIVVLPIPHPLWFAGWIAVMLLTLMTVLIPYQRQGNEITYQQLIFWERLAMVFGAIGLLGVALP